MSSDILKLVPFTEDELVEVQTSVVARMLILNKGIKADPRDPHNELMVDEMRTLSGIIEKTSKFCLDNQRVRTSKSS